MNPVGFGFVVLVDAVCWAVLYWFWAVNALPVLVAVSSGGVLFGSLWRLQTVMDAPYYDRPAAHQYANMACWAAVVCAVAALFL